MKLEDLKVLLAPHDRASKGLIKLQAGDVLELGAKVKEPSRAVRALMLGANTIVEETVKVGKPEEQALAIEVFQQACDLYELTDALEG